MTWTLEQCDEMTDQRGVDSIDDEGSVTSSNIQDLINHVKMSNREWYPPSSRECNTYRQESHSEIDSLLTWVYNDVKQVGEYLMTNIFPYKQVPFNITALSISGFWECRIWPWRGQGHPQGQQPHSWHSIILNHFPFYREYSESQTQHSWVDTLYP